jgi:20S proteasome subunit beta 7
MARFRDLERLRQLGTDTIIGGGGEYSDFQEIMSILDDLMYCFV